MWPLLGSGKAVGRHPLRGPGKGTVAGPPCPGPSVAALSLAIWIFTFFPFSKLLFCDSPALYYHLV